MRENRLSGSEGGGVEANRLSLPLYRNVSAIFEDHTLDDTQKPDAHPLIDEIVAFVIVLLVLCCSIRRLLRFGTRLDQDA